MPSDKRKILFVGGIPAMMTEEEIDHHFSKHCRVTKVRIMREKKTQEPKGFAFVTLADASMVPVMLNTIHVIEGRKVDVQLASRKGEKNTWKEDQKKKRIFVSNLPCQIGNEELAEHFSRFGEVRNAYIIRDYLTDQSKNYGYVEFKEVGIVHTVLLQQVTIGAHRLVCLPYIGRHEPRNNQKVIKEVKDGDEKPSDCCYAQQQQSSGSIAEEIQQEKVIISRPGPHLYHYEPETSKYEFIGMSRFLCQDESNYAFKTSSFVSRHNARRSPTASTRLRLSCDNSGGNPCTSLAKYNTLKAWKRKENAGSHGNQSETSPKGSHLPKTNTNSNSTIVQLAPSTFRNYCCFTY